MNNDHETFRRQPNQETPDEYLVRFQREADAVRRWTIWFAVYSFVLLCIGWLARGWLA